MQEHVSDSCTCEECGQQPSDTCCGEQGTEPILARADDLVTCLLCGEEGVDPDKQCEIENCPVATARRMRIAAVDTPFELGI
jgi:hypothetical protein